MKPNNPSGGFMQETNPTPIKTCPNISNTFTIEYRITDTTLELISNTGGGFFSKEPISIDELIDVMPHREFTSVNLRPALKGRSLNTSGFVLAILLAEGMAIRLPGKRYKFVRALHTSQDVDRDTAPTTKTSRKKSIFDLSEPSPDAEGDSTVSIPVTPQKSPRKRPTRSKTHNA